MVANRTVLDQEVVVVEQAADLIVAARTIRITDPPLKDPMVMTIMEEMITTEIVVDVPIITTTVKMIIRSCLELSLGLLLLLFILAS